MLNFVVSGMDVILLPSCGRVPMDGPTARRRCGYQSLIAQSPHSKSQSLPFCIQVRSASSIGSDYFEYLGRVLINILSSFVFGVVRMVMTEYERLQLERLERERVAKASQDDASRRFQARAAAIAGIVVTDR